jgi:hypothetical protein
MALYMSESLQFLEFSIPCPDVGESLAWYRQLGFAELKTGDIRTHHYAVVSDGDFCIGLHDSNYASLGLSFVRPDVASHVRSEQLAGHSFEFTRLGVEDFNEAAQIDPDGTLMVMLEARTFSPGIKDTQQIPLTGHLEHLILPCMRLDDAVAFWQRYNFIVVESGIAGMAELHSPHVTLQLREGTRHPELHFRPIDYAASLQAMEQTNIALQPANNGYCLTSPEGTRLIISNASTMAE